MELIDSSWSSSTCPKCNQGSHFVIAPNGSPRKVNTLVGPFYRYEKRENELYFDLKKKYICCTDCGVEINILDIEVMIESLSSRLPPRYARAFSMKNLHLYRVHPRKAKLIIQILMDDFEPDSQMLLPVES